MRNSVALAGILAIVGTCTYLGYEVIRMDRLVDAGASMSLRAQKFDRLIEDKHDILILGDSLAYGVGVSKPERSFAGILANHFESKSVRNKAVIGETIESLDRTLDQKITARYEKIYIIVGGNDIMRIHINVMDSRESLKSVIARASQHADQVILVTTGDFNNVSLSPWLLKSIYAVRAEIIRSAALGLEAQISNFNYVDFKTASIEKKEYKQLEAADGYHLNDKGIQKLVSTMFADN